MINIFEINSKRWADTSFLKTDGKKEFRERREYGNRHVVFEKGSEWGIVHYDKYNATDFPIGTINHGAYFVEEKTGVPKNVVIGSFLAAIGIMVGAYMDSKQKKEEGEYE